MKKRDHCKVIAGKSSIKLVQITVPSSRTIVANHLSLLILYRKCCRQGNYLKQFLQIFLRLPPHLHVNDLLQRYIIKSMHVHISSRSMKLVYSFILLIIYFTKTTTCCQSWSQDSCRRRRQEEESPCRISTLFHHHFIDGVCCMRVLSDVKLKCPKYN